MPEAARGWPRTETRVMNMLLHALPADIQEDLVSTQRMSTDQIMFKLYTIFQPGGQTSLLQLLVDWKSPSNNAAEVAASIRKWKRWAVRSEELHLVFARSTDHGWGGRYWSSMPKGQLLSFGLK